MVAGRSLHFGLCVAHSQAALNHNRSRGWGSVRFAGMLGAMAIPLDNDRWGYESNCYVCEQKNSRGLRIPFQLDDDGVTVSADFELDPAYSGAPALLHGGVLLAILDEGQAWACIAVAGKWGLTASTSADFDGPAFVDHPYRMEARVVEVGPSTIETSGQILDGVGTIVTRSQSTFHVVGEVDSTTGKNALDDGHRYLLGE